MTFAYIVSGAIAVPFAIMAIFLLNGKGAFLIAGYNTMSAEKRSTYDTKALCRAVGRLLLVLSFGIMLYPISFHLESPWIMYVAIAISLVLPIGFTIYANTGNRFRINIDPESFAVKTRFKNMPRPTKAAIIAGCIFTGLILISVGVMIITGEIDPVVNVRADSIEISAMYGLTIDASDIAEISLIDKSMREIGVGSRTNGYSSGSPALKGHFYSATLGSHMLFVYSTSSPTIQIERPMGRDIYLSFRSSEKTLEVYREMTTLLH
jgi:hypothetical protein